MVNLLINPTMGHFHRVKFIRDVNECKAGDIKDVMISPMIGRIYKPGRGLDGKFLDTVGVPDKRISVMGLFDYRNKIMDEFYHVFCDSEDLHNSLEEIPITEYHTTTV